VFFIHHVSKWIQVSNLIFDITTNSLKVVKEHFKGKEEVHPDAPWEDWEYAEIKNVEPKRIFPTKSGYLQLIDMEGLLQQTKAQNVIVRIEKRIGEFVDEDTPILSVWKMGQEEAGANLSELLTIGRERATIQDIEFGITKLVEIALRASSPGINDPNTAINCIAQLGKVLAALGQRHLPRSFTNDDERNLRIIMEQPSFQMYLYKSFFQIRHYGKEDVSILAAILESLILIAERNDDIIQKEVWKFTEYIVEGIHQETLLSLDKQYLQEKLNLLAKKTGQKMDSLRL
jgi:uncharacterized membrane protein